MAEEGAFDESADGVEFVGVELVEGFEVEAEVGVGGAAFVVVEDERVCAGVESKGELAEHVEGGLVGARFVAADVGDVDAARVGKSLLGEASLFAEDGEAFCEVHVDHLVVVGDRDDMGAVHWCLT